MEHFSKWLATLAVALLPLSAFGYDLRLSVDGLPVGTAFRQPQIVATWNVQSGGAIGYNWTAQGALPTIVVVNCANGHRCLQDEVPAGTYGSQWGAWGHFGYYLSAAPGRVTVLEWDETLESGFDMHSLGKLPMAIEVWSNALNGYSSIRTNWQCSSATGQTSCASGKAVFVNYMQANGTVNQGGHNGCLSSKGTTAIQTGVPYHFKQQQDLSNPMRPIADIWIKAPSDSAPVNVFHCTWNAGNTGASTTHSVRIDHDSWAGGAGSNDKLAVNSYSLESNIHAYTIP